MPSEEVLGGVGNVINIVVFCFHPLYSFAGHQTLRCPQGKVVMRGGEVTRGSHLYRTNLAWATKPMCFVGVAYLLFPATVDPGWFSCRLFCKICLYGLLQVMWVFGPMKCYKINIQGRQQHVGIPSGGPRLNSNHLARPKSAKRRAWRFRARVVEGRPHPRSFRRDVLHETCFYQQSRSTGCDPWRLGVPMIHSLDGTKNHPVL